MDSLIAILVPVSIALVALFAVGVVITRLYRRASKETAFVRTGAGGAKAILDGGALVLPVFHEIVPVSLKTHKLIIRKAQGEALITNDNLRADVTVEFYVRVAPNKESIEAAAQTLGNSTNDPEKLKDLIEGKFVDALRAVAAEVTRRDLHLNRAGFVHRVQTVVKSDLEKNGLELEAASLTGLDQTKPEFFDPENSFDAQGLAKLKSITEAKRLERFKIEQETEVKIQQKDLEATREKLNLKQQTQDAQMQTEREIAMTRARQQAEIAAQEAESRKAAEAARIESERQIQEAEIQKAKALELAQQQRDAEVAEQSKKKSAAEAEAAKARAEAVRSEEAVETARAVERAERDKQVKLVEAAQEAEQDAIAIRIAASAEKEAAQERSEAKLIAARAEAEAEKTRADAQAEVYRVEAEGQRAINEARNVLSPDVIAAQIREKLIETLPEILAQAVKPMEKIDSIRIVQMNGMGPIAGAGAGGGAANDSLADQVVNASLKHKAFGPLVDSLVREAGLSGLSGRSAAEGLAALAGVTATAPVTPEEAAPQGEPRNATGPAAD